MHTILIVVHQYIMTLALTLIIAKLRHLICVPLRLRATESACISDRAPCWFSSYLTDRRKAIKIGNCFSDMLPTSSCGVLGPLLFTLYTTPLSSVIQRHIFDHHIYVDDTHIYVSLPTPDICRSLNQVKDCFQDVSLRVNNSKLKLNADKTEFLIIGTPTQRDGSPPHMF